MATQLGQKIKVLGMIFMAAILLSSTAAYAQTAKEATKTSKDQKADSKTVTAQEMNADAGKKIDPTRTSGEEGTKVLQQVHQDENKKIEDARDTDPKPEVVATDLPKDQKTIEDKKKEPEVKVVAQNKPEEKSLDNKKKEPEVVATDLPKDQKTIEDKKKEPEVKVVAQNKPEEKSLDNKKKEPEVVATDLPKDQKTIEDKKKEPEVKVVAQNKPEEKSLDNKKKEPEVVATDLPKDQKTIEDKKKEPEVKVVAQNKPEEKSLDNKKKEPEVVATDLPKDQKTIEDKKKEPEVKVVAQNKPEEKSLDNKKKEPEVVATDLPKDQKTIEDKKKEPEVKVVAQNKPEEKSLDNKKKEPEVVATDLPKDQKTIEDKKKEPEVKVVAQNKPEEKSLDNKKKEPEVVATDLPKDQKTIEDKKKEPEVKVVAQNKPEEKSLDNKKKEPEVVATDLPKDQKTIEDKKKEPEVKVVAQNKPEEKSLDNKKKEPEVVATDLPKDQKTIEDKKKEPEVKVVAQNKPEEKSLDNKKKEPEVVATDLPKDQKTIEDKKKEPEVKVVAKEKPQDKKTQPELIAKKDEEPKSAVCSSSSFAKFCTDPHNLQSATCQRYTKECGMPKIAIKEKTEPEPEPKEELKAAPPVNICEDIQAQRYCANPANAKDPKCDEYLKKCSKEVALKPKNEDGTNPKNDPAAICKDEAVKKFCEDPANSQDEKCIKLQYCHDLDNLDYSICDKDPREFCGEDIDDPACHRYVQTCVEDEPSAHTLTCPEMQKLCDAGGMTPEDCKEKLARCNREPKTNLPEEESSWACESGDEPVPAICAAYENGDVVRCYVPMMSGEDFTFEAHDMFRAHGTSGMDQFGQYLVVSDDNNQLTLRNQSTRENLKIQTGLNNPNGVAFYKEGDDIRIIGIGAGDSRLEMYNLDGEFKTEIKLVRDGVEFEFKNPVGLDITQMGEKTVLFFMDDHNAYSGELKIGDEDYQVSNIKAFFEEGFLVGSSGMPTYDRVHNRVIIPTFARGYYEYDLSTGEHRHRQVDFEDHHRGINTRGSAVTADGSAVFVGNYDDGSIFVCDNTGKTDQCMAFVDEREPLGTTALRWSKICPEQALEEIPDDEVEEEEEDFEEDEDEFEDEEEEEDFFQDEPVEDEKEIRKKKMEEQKKALPLKDNRPRKGKPIETFDFDDNLSEDVPEVDGAPDVNENKEIEVPDEQVSAAVEDGSWIACGDTALGCGACTSDAESTSSSTGFLFLLSLLGMGIFRRKISVSK